MSEQVCDYCLNKLVFQLGHDESGEKTLITCSGCEAKICNNCTTMCCGCDAIVCFDCCRELKWNTTDELCWYCDQKSCK